MRIEKIVYSPIGIVRSSHQEAEATPIQPVFAGECTGEIEVFPEFAAGLRDLEGFSHIYVLYHFHRAGQMRLLTKPFLQDVDRGIFATRAPCRPNPIGLSILTLLRVEGRILYVSGVDILDGTPVLDVKPYTARFDCISTSRNGWQDDVDDATAEHRGKRNFRKD